MITIGILGLGVVGKGVAEIIKKNASLLKKRTGKTLFIKTAMDRDPAKISLAKHYGATFTQEVSDILNDPEIDIVVEALGGEHPAYEFICDALNAKKYVVTSNKEVVAKHKMEFFKLAAKNSVDIFFESAVGGGVPLIRTVKVGLAANEIQALYGILNGTTNYILTKIEEEQKEFSAVLKEAQALGLAEADPSMDISGLDAAYKLVILTAVAFKMDVQLSDIYYTGIESISLKDIQYAKDLGFRIKLLATAKSTKKGNLSLKVHPVLIPETHLLASISNEFNAVFTVGNMVGETMISGKGAGSLATASAIVSDIIDISFDWGKSPSTRNLELSFSTKKLLPISETESQFYVRLLVPDSPGVLEKITGILGRNKISVSNILQKDMENHKAEVVIVTHMANESDMVKATKTLKSLKGIDSVENLIRVGL